MSRERIPVALLGMNERSLSLLKMFFDGAGREHFEVVEERRAKAGIFDLDTPGGEKLWRAYRELYRWPSIVLSVNERDLPDAIWVRKPFVLEALAVAAQRLGDAMEKARARSAPVAAKPPKPDEHKTGWARLRALGDGIRQRGHGQAESATQAAAAKPDLVVAPVPTEVAVAPRADARVADRAAQAAAQAVNTPLRAVGSRAGKPKDGFCRETVREASPQIHQYCGEAVDLDPDNAQQREQMFYRVRSNFQAALVAAWRKARETQRRVLLRTVNDKVVLLCPKTALATTNFSNKTLRSICVMKLERGDVRAELLGDASPGPQGADLVTVNADTLLWNVALWTSKGRLPSRIEPDAFVRLRHWPNFTRLTRTPHAMRIAALWAEQGASLIQTARLLGVPQRYVFSLFSAADALDLIEIEAAVAPQQRSAPVLEQVHKNRGLFSRLLSRFAGQ